MTTKLYSRLRLVLVPLVVVTFGLMLWAQLANSPLTTIAQAVFAVTVVTTVLVAVLGGRAVRARTP